MSACIVRAAFRTCALPYHLFSPARLSEQVRMRVVDGGALARYRDAVSRQVNQQGQHMYSLRAGLGVSVKSQC